MENKYQTVQLPNELFFFRGNTVPHGVKGKILEKVEYPDEGGILTYFKDMKYPFRGFLEIGSIGRVNTVKKYIKKDLIMFSSTPLIIFLPFILILPNFPFRLFDRVMNKWLSLFAQNCYEVLRVDWYDSNNYKLYSEPVSEILRVLTKVFDAKNPETAWIILSIATILEQDKAYRFRIQDAFSLFDCDEFNKNPRKELSRVIAILVKRDSARDWKGLSRMIRISLFLMSIFRRKIYKKVIEFFKNLNAVRLTLSQEDLYWCLGIDGYDFLGKNLEERMAIQKNL